MSIRCYRIAPRHNGHAVAEVIVGMLALTPFLIGLPLLGKQLDIKHKTYDATRYSVWERTVWSDRGGNRKSADDITLEARDRTLGHPKGGIINVSDIRALGVTENPFWLDRHRHRLLAYRDDAMPIAATHTYASEPVGVGTVLVPTMAYEGRTIAAPARLVGLEPLGMSERALVTTHLRVEIRPKLAELASRPPSLRRESPQPVDTVLVQAASGAILSDTWSARNESNFRTLVDRLTVDEAIGTIELPARAIGALALGKGKILYGEGQFGWDPDFRPTSTTLPRAYVHTTR